MGKEAPRGSADTARRDRRSPWCTRDRDPRSTRPTSRPDLAARVGFHATATIAEAGPGAYAVHTDHDDPGLPDALEKVIRAGPRFVGVMGSRRHTGHHLEELRRRGLPEEAVAATQSPVGLDIGARSAPEIALSILAGLLAIRSGAPGGWKGSQPR